MSKRRPTIGPNDPLAVVLGEAPASSAAAPRAARRGPRPDSPARPRKTARQDAPGLANARGAAPVLPPRGRSQRVTFHLPAELVDEARNAVVALAGPPVRLTLARLVADALRRELDRLNKAHHAGKPWPRRAGELVGGRPIR